MKPSPSIPIPGIVYETEDRGDGLLYRFIPNKPGELTAGGRLQVLKVKGKARSRHPQLSNKNARRVLPGHVFEVEWTDIDDVESPNDDLRYRGFEDLGAARFARGEGMWWDKGWIYCRLHQRRPEQEGPGVAIRPQLQGRKTRREEQPRQAGTVH